MDTTKQPKHNYLKDYSPPDYWVDEVGLIFNLDPEITQVYTRLTLRRNAEKNHVTPPPLHLDGQGLTLRAIKLDGTLLAADQYRQESKQLIISNPPDRFVLEIHTTIHPGANTSLEGLYQSGSLLCTQCEAEGFRHITYYPDRPDVMARFTTTLIAETQQFPILLSNGNRCRKIPDWHQQTGQSILAADRLDKQMVTWEDPHKKPSYLFALIAGPLICLRDQFTTQSGRLVNLEIYCEPDTFVLDTVATSASSNLKNQAKTDKLCHAMAALKKSMLWDEKHFGREYDLDTYMIVAVNNFNMGAMENKGLNIFNAKYVLANQESATDRDFQFIEGIIAHEYFHNWTGNRITCRDWFQLSLKEGLTVFRDQMFSTQTTSAAVQRIEDARLIRTHQFAEDGGPTAHSVQPDSYIEINNFYTITVYNKGAEVVRMIHTLLGTDLFRQGMDLYFQRHDGQAVTVEQFVQAMEAASGRNLQQFRRWYHQAGTPRLSITSEHDAQQQTVQLHIKQSCPATPGQSEKQPFHIPLKMALLDPSGTSLPLVLQGENPGDSPASGATSRILEIRQAEEHYIFTGIRQKPIPSLLQNFSAPVILESNSNNQDQAFLLAHDPDPFNRWNAGQSLGNDVLLTLIKQIQSKQPRMVPQEYVESYAQVLQTEGLDPATKTLILTLPTETSLLETMPAADPEAIHTAHLFLRQTLSRQLHDRLLAHYHRNVDEEASQETSLHYDPLVAGRRSLKNLCLALLVTLQSPHLWQLARLQFESCKTMSDRMAALTALLYSASPEAKEALASFEQQWQHDTLVMDKWFSIQARIPEIETLQRLQTLQKHRLFSLRNPNRVRALLGSFCHANPRSFHQASGASYQFLVQQVQVLDQINPQVTARLVSSLSQWQKLEPGRQEKMVQALRTLYSTHNLSRDVFEIVSKSLAADGLA